MVNFAEGQPNKISSPDLYDEPVEHIDIDELRREGEEALARGDLLALEQVRNRAFELSAHHRNKEIIERQAADSFESIAAHFEREAFSIAGGGV